MLDFLIEHKTQIIVGIIVIVFSSIIIAFWNKITQFIISKLNIKENESLSDTKKYNKSSNLLELKGGKEITTSINKKPPFDIDTYKTYPSPVEIMKEINSAALFQQETICKNYEGLKIKWLVELFSIYKENNPNKVKLVLIKSKEDCFPTIWTNVSLDNYPELKIANRGTKLWIAGKIIEVEKLSVWVEVEQLKIIND